jgi:hypothetical protein
MVAASSRASQKSSIKTNIGKKGAKQLTPKELKIFTDLDLFLNVICIFTIIIGVLVYIGEKKYELGNKFTILKYLVNGDSWAQYTSSFSVSDIINTIHVGATTAVMAGSAGKIAISQREA